MAIHLLRPRILNPAPQLYRIERPRLYHLLKAAALILVAAGLICVIVFDLVAKVNAGLSFSHYGTNILIAVVVFCALLFFVFLKTTVQINRNKRVITFLKMDLFAAKNNTVHFDDLEKISVSHSDNGNGEFRGKRYHIDVIYRKKTAYGVVTSRVRDDTFDLFLDDLKNILLLSVDDSSDIENFRSFRKRIF